MDVVEDQVDDVLDCPFGEFSWQPFAGGAAVAYFALDRLVFVAAAKTATTTMASASAPILTLPFMSPPLWMCSAGI